MPKGDFEVLIVSDGPDEATENIVAAYASREKFNIRYLSTAVKKGPAAARNIGWLSARSSLIAFTDDDCRPASDWLTTLCSHYLHEELIAFSGKTIVPLPNDPTDYERNISQLETADFITANCMCTKQALIQAGGFDERFKTAWREDSDLEFKFIEQGIPIKKIADAHVTHPVRSPVWGVSIKEQKKVMYDALLFKKFPTLYRKKIRPRPLWNYYFINFLFILLLFSIVARSPLLFFFCFLALVQLMTEFVLKRLKNNKKSTLHILEMIATSLIIPFLSVYWRTYGAIKHRVFFL